MAKTKRQTVSVIIVCWNNRSLLEECLGSLQKQRYTDFNTILVDNGSSDDSVQFVRDHFPDVTVIETGANLGFAVANNLGIKRALENPDCRYLALLNTDCTMRPDWLEAMVDFADQHPDGALFQALTLDYYDHAIVDSCGIQIDWAGLAIQLGYRQYGLDLDSRPVFGVNAAAALYSRRFLESQPFGDNYFDGDLFMYLEDIDIAARAVMMGWNNYFVSTTEAYHMGSVSSSKNPSYSLFMTYRNNLPVLVKNLPTKALVRIAPRIVMADYKRLRGLAGNNEWRSVKAIILGRLRSLPMLPRFYLKRQRLKRHWKVSFDKLWELMKRPDLPQKLPVPGREVISVVVLSNDSYPALPHCLDALKNQAHDRLHIIVVENQPNHDHVADLEADESLSVLPQPTDRGDATAYALGIIHALEVQKPDYVALIRAELKPHSDWLKRLVKELETDRSVGVVGSLVESFDQSWENVAGRLPFKHLTEALSKGPRPVLAVSDQACLIRTQVLRDIGYLDGDYFQGLEDIDFCLRAELLGYQVIHQPAAGVELQQPIARSKSQFWYRLIRNYNYLWIRDIPSPLARQWLPHWWRTWLSLSAEAARQGSWLAPIKSSVKTGLRLPALLRQRGQLQRRRRLSTADFIKLVEPK